MNFAGTVDHTFLKTVAEGVSVEKQGVAVATLCEEAAAAACASVCVRPNLVRHAKNHLRALSSGVLITTVIGFPDGEKSTTEQKVARLHQARRDGADEYDYVINFQDVQEKNWLALENEAVSLCAAAGMQTLKAIVETCLWDEATTRRIYAALVAGFSMKAGHRFLKTSTGFSKRGANLGDVELMRSCAPSHIGIKAAGGVKNAVYAEAFWKAAGAPMKHGRPDPTLFRIGSSSLLTSLSSSDY